MDKPTHIKLNDEIFKLIGKKADELNVDAYVIGGYVRDIFLKRNSKDIDIMSVGRGIDLAEAVASELKMLDKLVVYKNFGTALINYNDYIIEFVGARKESYRSDSRKPVVEDGTLMDDISRRDFTINAMAISINEKTFGELIDKYDGYADMERGLLRTPLEPDITYTDDPLRMLRAIRFSSQLDFYVDDPSFNSIGKNADRVKILSKERVIDEINKIILSPIPSKGFKLLFKTGILHHVFPEMVALEGVEKQNGKSHKDNFYHTLQVLDNLSENTDNLWLRWAAILHDIAKPPTKRFEEGAGWTFHGHEDLGARMVPGIFKRLSLPLNEKMKYVQKLVQLHLRPIALTKEHISDSAIRRLIFDAGDDLEDLMLLCNADITSKNEEKVKRYLKNFELVKEKIILVEEKDRIRNFQPPVSGELIMKTFGIGPSKHIGEIKTAVKDAILDGIIENNPEQAFEFMVEIGKKLGLTPQ